MHCCPGILPKLPFLVDWNSISINFIHLSYRMFIDTLREAINNYVVRLKEVSIFDKNKVKFSWNFIPVRFSRGQIVVIRTGEDVVVALIIEVHSKKLCHCLSEELNILKLDDSYLLSHQRIFIWHQLGWDHFSSFIVKRNLFEVEHIEELEYDLLWDHPDSQLGFINFTLSHLLILKLIFYHVF